MEHGVQAGKEIELKGHSDSVDQVSWDPTAVDRLATISADKSLRLWDIRAGSRCVANVAMSGENINVNWHPDGTCLAVGNRDDVVSFVDARTHKVTRTEKYPYEVNEIAWDASGDVFYLTTGLGTVEVLAYPELTHLHTIRAHTAGLYCMAFDASRPRMALGSADALVSLWDLDEFTCLRTFSRLSWPVRTVSFSHDGRFLASASEDLCVDVADAEDGTCAYRIPTRAAMNSVRWSPTEYLLAYAGDDEKGGRGKEQRGVRSNLGRARDETDRSRDARERERRERDARETRERREREDARETRERRERDARETRRSPIAYLRSSYLRSSSRAPAYVRPILRSWHASSRVRPRATSSPSQDTHGERLMFDGAHRLSAGDDVGVRERRGVAHAAGDGTRAARLNAASLAPRRRHRPRRG